MPFRSSFSQKGDRPIGSILFRAQPEELGLLYKSTVPERICMPKRLKVLLQHLRRQVQELTTISMAVIMLLGVVAVGGIVLSASPALAATTTYASACPIKANTPPGVNPCATATSDPYWGDFIYLKGEFGRQASYMGGYIWDYATSSYIAPPSGEFSTWYNGVSGSPPANPSDPIAFVICFANTAGQWTTWYTNSRNSSWNYAGSGSGFYCWDPYAPLPGA